MSDGSAYAAPRWAASQRVGDVGTKATLQALATRADKDHTCFPSQTTLAEETEQSPRTVWKQVKWLERVGLITRERRYDKHGHRTSDLFQLNLAVSVDVKKNPDLLVNSASRDAVPTRTQVATRDAAPTRRLAASRDAGPTRNATQVPYSQPGCEGTPSELLDDDSLRSSGPQTAQTLVAEWVSHCRQRSPRRVVGQVAREVKALLAEGFDYDLVRAVLADWDRRGLHPSVLPSLVHERLNATGPAFPKPATTDERVQAGMAMREKCEAMDAMDLDQTPRGEWEPA